jgi:hypothetical protein
MVQMFPKSRGIWRKKSKEEQANLANLAKAHTCQPFRKRKQAKEIHERSEVITLKLAKDEEARRLLLEEATELVHHAATLVGGRAAVGTTGRGTAVTFAVVLVLLDRVLGNATYDGSTDSSEEAVVGLVAGETSRGTACEGTGKTALTLLGLSGSTVLLLLVPTMIG